MTRLDVSFCWDINASAAQKSSKQKSQHDDVAVALVLVPLRKSSKQKLRHDADEIVQRYKLEHSGEDVVFMRVTH